MITILRAAFILLQQRLLLDNPLHQTFKHYLEVFGGEIGVVRVNKIHYEIEKLRQLYSGNKARYLSNNDVDR